MKKISLTIILLLLFIPAVKAEQVKLFECVYGDTAKFITTEGTISTRFLAIDTPEYTKEKEPWGEEASQFTCSKLKSAQTIELEYDQNSDRYDRYKRLLAWVFVDGNLLQQDIVKLGYGEVAYLYGDYKYTSLLETEQVSAQTNKLGIWSLTPVGEREVFDWFSFVLVAFYIIYVLFFKKSWQSLNVNSNRLI